jgi:hypothetical protein
MERSGIPRRAGGRYAISGVEGVWPQLEAEGA